MAMRNKTKRVFRKGAIHGAMFAGATQKQAHETAKRLWIERKSKSASVTNKTLDNPSKPC